MIRPQSPTREGVAADHARIAARRPRALPATALRVRSVHAREILAEAAWPGHTATELVGWATRGADAGPPPDSDPVGVADFARVLAVQTDSSEDTSIGQALLEQVVRSDGRAELRREHLELLAQLRVLGGEAHEALSLATDARVREGVATAIAADALNSHLYPGADPTRWAVAFSEALGHGRLSPILPPGPQGPEFDHLMTRPSPEANAPFLITVIMSCYQPGANLRTAVGSVLRQTWQDLELLVVDDASDARGEALWPGVLEEIEALDSRVRVIRKAVNGGTYRARNTALRQARGEAVIVIDSDDWWHPETLATCAEPLLQDQALMAVRAQGVRVPPTLVLTRPGYLPRFPSAATVLYRRAPVVNRIGFYDSTRKGADTEYTRRIEASFGSVVEDIEVATTLLRAGDATLSADEFANGYRHPARHQYKSLYSAWHEEISLGASSPFLDPDEPRRFPEPVRWARPTHPLLSTGRRFDLIVAGDWRKHGGPQRSMMEEIHAACSAGLQVGVMHLEAFRFMSVHDFPVSPPFVELVRSGMVTWVLPDDEVQTDVLLIRYPPILQYPPALARSVSAGEVLVVANQGPCEPDGSDQRYVVADVTARTEELFGRAPIWVPQSPAIRDLLLDQDPDLRLSDWDNPGLIDVDRWHVRRRGHPGEGRRPIVVGRHSRDTAIKFPPTWSEVQAGYSFPVRDYQVRMLGATTTVGRLRQEAGIEQHPANWQLLPPLTGDVRPFLADLDFYLYLDHPGAHEAFGRTLLEAAATGLVVIAHPKHRPTFGDVLDYANPGEAQALVRHYVEDPQAYRDRVEETLRLVRERYGRESFVRNLRLLLGHSGSAPPSSAPGEAAPTSSSTSPTRIRIARGSTQASVGGGCAAPQVEGALAEVIPLRSVADAERCDSLIVVHDGVPTDELAGWLRPGLDGHRDPQWSARTLLCSAPTLVRAVVLDREGTVLVAGRGQWHGTPAGRPSSPELVRRELGTHDLPDWSVGAWYRHVAPATITLTPAAR